MASFILLISLLWVALPVAMAAYDREGEDWRYLSEFFMWTEEHLQGKPEDARRGRAVGTFWDLSRAMNFRGQWLEPRPKDETPLPPRCGIFAYYPNMMARAAWEDSSPQPGQTTGRDPLAFSPWCEGTEESQPDWPGRKHKGDGGSRSVVWHNWDVNSTNRAQDCYLVLSNLKEDMLSSDDIKVEDFRSVKAHWAGGDDDRLKIKEAFKWDTELTGDPKADVMTDWIEDYIKSKHGGTLPNPYKIPRDDSRWPELSGINDFWGYGDDGVTWLRSPP